MSLWNCSVHGLYGGDVFCPHCGGTGNYVTLWPAQGIEAATAGETRSGSTVGESPVAARGDAPSLNPNSDRTTP